MVKTNQDTRRTSGFSVGLDDGVHPQGVSELKLPHPYGTGITIGARQVLRTRRLVRASILHELRLYPLGCLSKRP